MRTILLIASLLLVGCTEPPPPAKPSPQAANLPKRMASGLQARLEELDKKIAENAENPEVLAKLKKQRESAEKIITIMNKAKKRQVEKKP